MGRLAGVQGWESEYATPNAPSDSPREWRNKRSGCGVRHLVWLMGGLVQLVSIGIQTALPLLLARVEDQLQRAAFLAAFALFHVPAGLLVDQIGPSPVIVSGQVLSAIMLVVMPDCGLPCVLVLGAAQAGVAPALAQLLAEWARSPRERDSVGFSPERKRLQDEAH